MDRAMTGGIDDVGVGVLYGLNNYRYDFAGLLMHKEHLEAVFGVGPHTISVPRIRPADDISVDAFPNSISDDLFKKSLPSFVSRFPIQVSSYRPVNLPKPVLPSSKSGFPRSAGLPVRVSAVMPKKRKKILPSLK